MRKIVQQFFDLQEKVMKIPFKLFREPLIKRAFAKCGTNVHVAQGWHKGNRKYLCWRWLHNWAWRRVVEHTCKDIHW